MRVKRYVVDTMPDAMHSIRNELGSDAVILSTKEVKVGGFMGMFKKKKIEVVAAVEEVRKPAAPAAPPAQPLSVPRSAVPQAYQKAVTASSPPVQGAKEQTDNRTYAEVAAAIAEANGAAENRSTVAVLSAPEEVKEDTGTISHEPDAAPAASVKEKSASLTALHESLGAELSPAVSSALESDVLREIRDMKHWMERIARYSTSGAELPDRLEQLKTRLIEQETDAVLVDEWINNVFDRWNDEGRTWSEEQFGDRLLEQVNDFLTGRIAGGIAADTRIVYIAGPTGVGKTTTIAKLAAEQLFKQGRKVGLITSDTYRISAVEQLRTYAAILNIPLEVVQSPGDLQRAMFRLESCDLVLMDTAGRNYRNEMLVAELQSLLAKELKSETFLVLSMTSKSRDMKTIAEHFGRYQLDKVIFTKLDETGSCGPLFNVLNDFPLQLSYLANGQNVPDDLLMASKEQLTGMLLGTGGA
ncbi:flagellar biosynthesis protein FlhF [Paenibacillus sp. PK3_47]|uniref:flagellar biosynthesis protein FlhF n=1 Tax=Paenibacillus sp. PK3_47 TaxID=2072642 RepID=UPI00201E22EA|nr:flagellar biosynthesis protein FlhF [Paenibacillus sp. PK3_47]UQZ32100.1 flagellar biosynthesis protein FlhF [Paenibacillus sp. PK3_47]